MNEGYRQLAAKGSGRARVGTVTSVTLADSVCTVLVNEGEVPAYLTDHVWNSVAVGAVVTLLPVGDTYEVISTRTGTTGGGGLILGPELLPNPSFEFGDTDALGWGAYPWVVGDWKVERDTTVGESVSGEARLLTTLGPGTDAPLARAWNGSAVRLDAGVAYQCSAWMKAPTSHASLLTELWAITAPLEINAGPFGVGLTQHTIATVTNPGGAYQLLTGSFTVPAGHHYARVYMSASADATIPAPVSVSWDVVSLRQRITS